MNPFGFTCLIVCALLRYHVIDAFAYFRIEFRILFLLFDRIFKNQSITFLRSGYSDRSFLVIFSCLIIVNLVKGIGAEFCRLDVVLLDRILLCDTIIDPPDFFLSFFLLKKLSKLTIFTKLVTFEFELLSLTNIVSAHIMFSIDIIYEIV